MKKTLCAALLFLLLEIAAACLSVLHAGTDARLYLQCFNAYAQTERLGVRPGSYPDLAESLAGYLGGERESPQTLTPRTGAGTAAPAFNDRELTHLSDIRRIFSILARAWTLYLPAAGLALLLWKGRAAPASVWTGFLLSLLPWAGAAAWAALDFTGAFIALHRLAFTNELWLLNPNTDLLICLMPQEMFVFLARRLALTLAPAFLLPPTAAVLLHIIRKQRTHT